MGGAARALADEQVRVWAMPGALEAVDAAADAAPFELPPLEELLQLRADDDDAWVVDAPLGTHATAASGSAGGQLTDAAPNTDTDASEASGGASLAQLHRCMDRTHAPPCPLCTPAPAEGEEGACPLQRVRTRAARA